jgi:hypothetical protein
LLLSSGLRKHIKVLDREKVTLKQQAKELQKKLEVAVGGLYRSNLTAN